MTEPGNIEGLEGVVAPRSNRDRATNVFTDKLPQIEMDNDTARTILQAIVRTHENSFTEETPIDRIGGYTIEQVRQAEKIVTQSVMNKPNAERMEFGNLHIEKLSPEGKLETFFSDSKIYMRLVETKGPRQGVWVLENTFFLEDQQNKAQRYQTGFIDFRSEAESVISTLDGMDEKPTLATFQNMIRGLRWMSANLLEWDNPNTIMPEQLDSKTLPQAQPSAQIEE